MIKAILALALLSLPTAVQAQDPRFTEDFRPGQMVDVHQAFYVCVYDNPRDTMEQLIAIKDQTARHRRAADMGCRFFADNEPAVHRVLRLPADICLNVQGDGQHRWCGREGHQIVISRGKGLNGEQIEQTVIWLSLDQDYE